jgi:AcrR family transcriptional regulator
MSKSKKPAKPRWQRRKELRRPEILAAALAVFAARGFTAARLDEVATKAGVTKGTLYLYFKNKEALFKALIHDYLVPNLTLAQERVRSHTGRTSDLLLEVVHGLTRAIIGTPAGMMPKLVIADAGNFPEIARFYVDEVVSRGMEMFSTILARGIANGEFRQIDPAAAAPVIIGPLLLLAIWKNVLEPHATRKIDMPEYLRSYADIILRGVMAPGQER